MRLLVIEDEPLAADRLIRMIEEINQDFKVVKWTDSIDSSINWLKNNVPPDLIFMDIELTDGQSFSIFDNLNILTPVIFTTSYDEYAIKAFKLNSIDYLLKPIKMDDLKLSIEKFKAINQYSSQVHSMRIEQLVRQLTNPQKEFRDRFLVKNGQRYYSIETDEIAYFYFHNRVTFLKTINKDTYYIDYILDELEEMLPPKKFFRANRQYLINFKSVKNIFSFFNNKLKLELMPPSLDEVLISRERAAAFKEWMGK